MPDASSPVMAGSLPQASQANDAQPSSSPPRARRRSALELRWPDRALFYLMVAALHLLSLIPDFILYPLGAIGGRIAFWLDRRHVKIGLRNLSIAFPLKTDAARRGILRESYINLGRTAAEYIRLGGFFYRRLARRVTYDRIDYYDTIERQRRGVLVLTAHFGNFELLAAAHALHNRSICLVHHTQRFLAGDALMTFVRERAGVEILRKHSAARAAIKALRDGEMLGVPFDQNAKRSEAVFVPFFGEPAATASGVARLAMISRAPVVPVFLVRQPDRRHHVIVIREEIPVARTGGTDADVEENTRRFVGAIEEIVRQYPGQFLWTHRRYRTRPRGMPPVYD